jgi:prophage regulatory protein
MELKDTRILRFPEVVSRTGLSRSTVYGRIRAGDFPLPVPLGEGRAVGFLEREVNSWIDSLMNRREAA